MSQRPLASYEPNRALAWLYGRFFEHIEVDTQWTQRIHEAAAKGPVVYVLRNLSFVDFLALDYLTKRHRLPRIHFANDLGLFVFEPLGRGPWSALGRALSPAHDVDRLRGAIVQGGSAALFLKRPANLLETGARGRIEGDAFLRTLLALQRESERPIQLCPQVFVWSRGPDTAGLSPLDAVFGSREWPGKLRTLSQFALNYRHVTLRAGAPLDLASFMQQAAGESDETLLRRATYTLLRRLERERRAVTGPMRKPVDRVRAEVVRSPKLQKLLTDMGGESDQARAALMDRVSGMIQEMEANPEPAALGVLDQVFESTVGRMYASFEVDQVGLARLRDCSKDGTLVLLPCHKSHVDYIILSKIFHDAKMPVPLVAAGDNLNFFPLGAVLRRAGAFYIRRSFRGDRLYTAVLDAYVRRLIREGHPLEFFVEGGRSRTGKLLPPKLGLLSMVVEAALGGGRPVYFCPIALGYERMVEESAYVRELSGGSKEKEDVSGLFRSARLLQNRYGHLSVQFAEPIPLATLIAEQGAAPPDSIAPTGRTLSPARRRALVTKLATRVMSDIQRASAVTPGALVAAALLKHRGRGLSHPELESECIALFEHLRREGARFSPSLLDGASPPRLRRGALLEACELFFRAKHVQAERLDAPLGSKERKTSPGIDAVYKVPDEARLSLDLAKNGIVHFFVARGLVALALLSQAGPSSPDSLQERFAVLARLLRYEFVGDELTGDDRFAGILASMLAHGEVEPCEEGYAAPRREGRAALLRSAHMLDNFVEGYRVAARTLGQLKKPMPAKELTSLALLTGERMFVAGEIHRREAVARPLFDNAWLAFVDFGYLVRGEGELALAPSYATAELARTIEARIAQFRLGDDDR